MPKTKSTKEPTKTDDSAPKALRVIIQDSDGNEWGVVTATTKQFSSGSVGFYANGKVVNPGSGEKYQVGGNIILVGSKPKE